MTEAEFRRALRFGLGRALQFTRRTRPFPYRQALLDACVECQTYDPQVDGTLGSFIWDVLEASGEKPAGREVVLRSLETAGDDHHAEKRFWLAMLFALEGDDEMRRVMHEQFRPGPRHGDGVGISFLEMDGLKGFLFPAGRIGMALREQGDQWDFGWFLSHAEEALGTEEAMQALREAAEGDADLARFLAMAEARSPGGGPRAEHGGPVSFEDLCARPRSRVSPIGWGRRAAEAELAKAADAVLARGEQEPWLLSIFHWPAFPHDPAPLIAWAESDNAELARRSCVALRNVVHPAVRTLGIRLRDIQLLERNSQPGDHAMILRWLADAVDDEDLHGIGQDALSFWKAHPDAETAAALLRMVYERMPCTQCRETAVRRMIEFGNVPSEIAEECAFDGSEEIRALSFC